MHARLLLILSVLSLGGFFYLYTQNQGVVSVVLWEGHSYTLPLVIVLFMSFLAGAVVVGIDAVVSDARKAVRDAKARKAAAVLKEARRNYLAGLDALARGDTAGARELIKKALDSQPGEPDMVFAMAETYIMEGKPGAALDILETESFHNPKSVVILTAIGRCAMDAGEISRAARAFEDVLRLNTTNTCALERLRDICIKKGRWLEAADYEKRILGPEKGGWFWGGEVKSGMLPGLLFEAARVHVDEGDYERAVELLKESLKRDEFFIPAWVLLGEIEARRAGSSEGLKVWERAYERHPGSVPLLLKMEEHSIKEAAPQRMIEMYKREIQKRPDAVNMRILLARFYLRLEMADRAAEELERLHNEDRESFYTKVLLGEAYFKKNRAFDAALMFKDALGMETGLPSPPFTCRICGRYHREWAPRCRRCGEWNSLDMNPAADVMRTGI